MKLLYLHGTAIDSEKANLIQVIQMCHAFANNGLDVLLALPKSNNIRGQKEYAEFIESHFGVTMNFSVKTFSNITVGGRLRFIGGYLGVKRLLPKIHYDVCFTRNSSFVPLVLKTKVPLIYESHNSVVHSGSKILDKFWRKKLINDSNNENLIGFVTISQALADFWLREGIPEKKILSLHDGVNQKKFEGVPDANFLREKFSLAEDKKIIMYVGSLYPDRGIDAVIDLAEIFKQAVFVIVGGPEQEKIEYEKIAFAKCLKNIIFIGRIRHLEVPAYLQSADILLMLWTSRVNTINYCSPLKTFEYMASGRLIVGHGFPTIKEVLEDGKTAFLVKPDSFESLRDKVGQAVITDEAEKIGARARVLAFDEYTWDNRAKRIVGLITRCKMVVINVK